MAVAVWAVAGVWAFLADTPSVTDLRVMPWYDPIVSILKPSVSNTHVSVLLCLVLTYILTFSDAVFFFFRAKCQKLN